MFKALSVGMTTCAYTAMPFVAVVYCLTALHVYIHVHVHVNERCRRKEERSKQSQTNNKAKQHNTPKAVTFPKKKELHVPG